VFDMVDAGRLTSVLAGGRQRKVRKTLHAEEEVFFPLNQFNDVVDIASYVAVSDSVHLQVSYPSIENSSPMHRGDKCIGCFTFYICNQNKIKASLAIKASQTA
jgi:hypothetical protein